MSSTSPATTSVITANELALNAAGQLHHRGSAHLNDVTVAALSSPTRSNSVNGATVVTTVSATGNGLPLISPNDMHHSPDSPQPELATMTNVNVLDLHTDSAKLYDKDAVFIYETPKVVLTGDVHSHHQQHNHQQHHHQQQEGHIIDARMVAQLTQQQQNTSTTNDNQPLAKIEFDENQIIRVVGSNGEQQQIISREIINGEHHILSRNEAGEHILTRIVSDPTKILPSDNAVAAVMFNQAQKLANDQHHGNGGAGGGGDGTGDATGVYQTSPLNASVLQHYDSETVIKTEVELYDEQKNKHTNVTNAGQIIYATTAATDGTNNGVNNKHLPHLTMPTKLEPDLYPDDKHIDLIYNDGNKTVIYTTSSDQKGGLEIYSGSDLSSLVADGQVVVQGGLQYASATGTACGHPVYIVADSLPAGVEGHIHR